MELLAAYYVLLCPSMLMLFALSTSVMNDPGRSTGQQHDRGRAFGDMMLKHEGDLLRLSRRLCLGDDDRAQDLVQDTFVRAYQAYLDNRFVGDAYRPWLMRILTNLFINAYQRKKKWEANVNVETLTLGGELGPPSTHASASDVPGIRLMENTLDEELERALAMLTEPLRLCAILVDIEGLDYAEAAKALGIPIGTVRSRLSRARMQLHDLLQGYARSKGYLR